MPIMVNTYYPPNQPTPKRCFDMGRAIRGAIESWPTKARVGILASGGLSHFVVDEELDYMAMDGMKEKSIVKLSRPAPRAHGLGQLGDTQLGADHGSLRALGHGDFRLRPVLPLAGGHRLRHGLRQVGLKGENERSLGYNPDSSRC